MIYFKRNLPGWERAIRLLSGLLLVAIAVLLSTSPPLMWVGVAAGLSLVGTSFVGFCPMCAMVGRKPVADNQ
jgi:hypothetical protein